MQNAEEEEEEEDGGGDNGVSDTQIPIIPDLSGTDWAVGAASKSKAPRHCVMTATDQLTLMMIDFLARIHSHTAQR